MPPEMTLRPGGTRAGRPRGREACHGRGTMSDRPGPVFSSAFDALLDDNRQRLDALYGGRPNASTPAPRAATIAAFAPVGKDRRSGRFDGLDFSFDI